MSEKKFKQLLKAFETYKQQVTKSPDSYKEFLKEMKVITPNGNPTKLYK